MSTVLIVLAVIAGIILTCVVTVGLFLRKIAVTGGVFLLRTGANEALASCNAEWVPADLKAECQSIHDEALALPAVSLFNAGRVFNQGKGLGLRLAAVLQRFEELRPKTVHTEEAAPELLTLPAPDTTTTVVIDTTATEAPPAADVQKPSDGDASGDKSAK